METLKEVKDKLREAIDSQDMKKFKNVIWPTDEGCPFPSYFKYDIQGHHCPECPLSEERGPKEFLGAWKTCLMGSMRTLLWNHADKKIGKITTLRALIKIATKLLPYLESQRYFERRKTNREARNGNLNSKMTLGM